MAALLRLSSRLRLGPPGWPAEALHVASRRARLLRACVAFVVGAPLLLGHVPVATAQADEPAPLSAAVAQAIPSLVSVILADEQGRPVATCSGFVVSEGVVATEYQPLEGSASARIDDAAGVTHPVAGLVAADPVANLALLQVYGFYAPALELSSAVPQAGEHATVLLTGQDGRPRVTEIRIKGLREMEQGLVVVRLGVAGTPLLGGAPLLDAAGRVIGLTHVLSLSGLETFYAIPSSRLARLLTERSAVPVPFPIGASSLSRYGTTDARPIGTLPPKGVTCRVTIPRGGLWRSPHGPLMVPDTAHVSDVRGLPLTQVYRDPKKGEYRCRADGSLRFAPEEAGRKVTVSYQYCPRRVALLPTCSSTDYEDAVPVLEQLLTEEMEARGFEVLSVDGTADAVAAAKQAAFTAGRPDVASWLPAVAEQLDAAYLLLPAIGADQARVLAGFQSFYSVSSRVSVQGNAVSAKSKVRGLTVPVVHDMMEVGVGITVYDGASGAVLTEQAEAGSKRVQLRQFSATRQGLIADLTGRVVRQWCESPL